MQDKGLKLALMAKRPTARNSMAVGMDLVKHGEADVFVTAGNTGGALATAYYRLGTIEGVERPALTALFPVKNGYCVVLDIGANPEVKPEHLLQFAIMGSIYAEKVLGVQRPRVGLISNGRSQERQPLVKDTFLFGSQQVELHREPGRQGAWGMADVAVIDGFTGNVLLKSSEAVASWITDMLRQELTRSLRTKIGALLAKSAFGSIRKMLDPAEIGAAPLLGIDGLVFIGHGRSDTAPWLAQSTPPARRSKRTCSRPCGLLKSAWRFFPKWRHYESPQSRYYWIGGRHTSG
jgi:glycerol-3-phosphate acyltransferase PlsX